MTSQRFCSNLTRESSRQIADNCVPVHDVEFRGLTLHSLMGQQRLCTMTCRVTAEA
jgi:hypothetical protein